MKGFGIYVKNDLLEPKHVEAMGVSIWLYLWFLDKMTSVSEDGAGKVLGGKPITYDDDILPELGLKRRTYARWINILLKAGYISIIRTPRGVSVTVHKAEKIFGSRAVSMPVNKPQELGKTDTPHMAHRSSDMPQAAPRSAKSGASDTPHMAHAIKTIQLDNTKTESAHFLDILNDHDVRRYLRDGYWQVSVDREIDKMISWAQSKKEKKKNWIAFAELWLAREVDTAKAKGLTRDRKGEYCIECGSVKSMHHPCRKCVKVGA